MSKVKIRTEHLPQRCEICHKSDNFDPINNCCARCNDVETPLLFKSYRYLPVLTNFGWQDVSKDLLGKIQKFLLTGMVVSYFYMVIIYNFGNPITTYVGQSANTNGFTSVGEDFGVICGHPAYKIDDIFFISIPFVMIVAAVVLILAYLFADD